MILEGEALVIGKGDFSETSQIISIFTRKYGVIRSLAKGAKRREKSSLLELGNLINFEIYKRLEGQLGVMGFELIQPYGSLALTASREYKLVILSLCETISCLFAEGCPYENFFQQTINLLEEPSALCYYIWEKSVICELGYGIFEGGSLRASFEKIQSICHEYKKNYLFNRRLLNGFIF